MKRHYKHLPTILLLSFILTGCQADPVQSQGDPMLAMVVRTDTSEEVTQSLSVLEKTPEPSISSTQAIIVPTVLNILEPTKKVQTIPTARPTLGPYDWQTLPIVPTEISQRAREIYQQGLLMGNDPTHFSKLGDCQNITTYFLAIYDSPDLYTLGEKYTYLQPAIDHFVDSWSRESMSVKGGFNVASVFNPMLSNREFCEKNESPLDCELRLHQPSIVLISMEEWWNGDSTKYENYLRKIVDTVIAHGAVPVLATKADNMEGKHKINRAIANLAYEYEIPLWNFWLAVQPITSHGLQKDGFHLTHGLNDFSSSIQLKRGWVQRNLTALQVLDAVWQGLQTP